MGKDILLVVLDSCRFDLFPGTDYEWVGSVEKRYSWSGWTLPSHLCLLSGLMPHKNLNVAASSVFSENYKEWVGRLGDDAVCTDDFLPDFWLPSVLEKVGCRCNVISGVPCLNKFTALNKGVDNFISVSHSVSELCIDKELDELDKVFTSPSFTLLNCPDTHYPFGLILPKMSGIRGAAAGRVTPESEPDFELGRETTIELMKRSQMERASYVAKKLREWCKERGEINLIVTSDHGELFGEDNFFGHGPFFHEKLFEVPYVEGIVNERI